LFIVYVSSYMRAGCTCVAPIAVCEHMELNSVTRVYSYLSWRGSTC